MDVRIGGRERDRTPPPVYTAGQNFVVVPDFPDEWRDVVPRADGQPGPRPDTYFGADWVRAERVRDIKLQTDLLFQFARLVAGHTGAQLDTYWKGGTGHQAMADMMIANVVSNFAPMSSAVEALPAGQAADERRRLEAAHKAELAHAFSLTTDMATRERIERFGNALALNEREETLRQPAQQREIERLLRTMPLKPGSGYPPRGAGTTSAPTTTMPEPPPPAAPGVPLTSASAYPQVARPMMRIRTTPLTSSAVPSVRDGAAAESVATATDAAGNIVYGVDDKWIMLLRLLLRGASEADLKAWRMLYSADADDPQQRLATDPAARARYLRDLASMHALLRHGEGDIDWVQAPQHTGYIFFSDSFGAGVATALSDVRMLCGRQWATELALMTHEDVRVAFSRLVAHHINAARTRAVSRYGGTQAMLRTHLDEHARLIAAFRRLTRNGGGFYTIGRGGAAMDEARAAYGGEAPLTMAWGGKAMRHAEEQRQRAHMATTGRYLSDAY